MLGLADAPLIAGHLQNVVYVVESHAIKSSVVKRSLSRLANSNANLIGAVLTKFNPKKTKASYGYEYGYSYGQDTAGRTA